MIGRSLSWGLFLGAIAGLALAALLSPRWMQMLSPSLVVGQVAPQDILAPRAIEYPSEVLTEQRRETVERAVLGVFTPPNTMVARRQLEQLRAALAFISSLRADSYASPEQKLADLAALEDLHLSASAAEGVLLLTDSRWQAIQQETIVVLEQVMRGTIRSDRVEDARNSVPTLVSLALPEGQAAIVAELAAAFVAPNSLFSPELTDVARQRASEAVEPVVRSFVTGETVVSRGRVLTAVDLEALQQLGLMTPRLHWQDPASAAALVVLMLGFMLLYVRRRPTRFKDRTNIFLVTLLFLGFLFSARLSIPGHTVIPYAFPLPAYGLVVAALFGVELALLSSLPLAVMAAFGLPNALDLTLYYALGSLVGVLALGRARRVSAFFLAGAAISVSGILIVLVYRLPSATTDWIGLATLSGASIFCGLASSSLTILLQFLIAQFLGAATPMQLMDLTRPDHPLLQLILRESPGTYQHSLQVANLAEQAAERIGADPLLTRVGALYHDAGKALNPVFFIENQMPGFINPHDDLDPVDSSRTIIRHVPDGLELARRQRLPRRISDFIAEHHGTMVTRYQYVKAVTAAGGDESKVDMDIFRYPGPRPQSRETAVLMLADGCEARVRAERPKDEAELRQLIKSVIDNRVSIGQLDDTQLTLKDLDTILHSFHATLRGIYHPRVPYPKLESSSVEAATIPVGAFTTQMAPDIPVESKPSS